MLLTLDELKELKKESHYSYREIAEKSGVPLGTVQKVFGGITTSPRRSTIEALTKVLMEEPDDYLYREKINSYINAVNKDTGAGKVSEMALEYEASESGLDDLIEHVLSTKKAGEFTIDDYYLISEKYRIELIDGEIFDMAAPVFSHQHIGGLVYYQMMNFRLQNYEKCIPAIAPLDVQLDADDKTMVQPDLIVLCDIRKNQEKKIVGAPDFVLEVFSPSSRFKDRTRKHDKYKDAGVREYWMVDPLNQRVIVRDFEGGLDGIYTFNQKVPVRISGGRLEIDFSPIKEDLRNVAAFD